MRDLHHSISTNEIKNELNGKGHLVRNIIVKHKATKEPLPLFFVDLDHEIITNKSTSCSFYSIAKLDSKHQDTKE
jgi:hypothetical protein